MRLDAIESAFGSGRFERTGFPAPDLLGPIVGRFDLGPFRAPAAGETGFFEMTHPARTDWAMLLGSLFLVWMGSGPWSVDAWRMRRARR